MFEIPKIWAGTHDSLDLLLDAMASSYAMIEARGASRDPFELPPLLDVREGVGIVSLKGPLVAGSAGFMRLFGITGYADFQEGLVEAVSDKSVKSILLDISSPGGAVEGVDEASEMIKQVAAVKPVITYAGGNMLSAGYWLGSGGGRRLASRTSMIGSIGVVVTHIERSRQLDKEGITPTVIRTGKWKALGGPLEPLSPLARAELEALAEDINQIFEARVATNLGVSQRQVHEKMGQGRQFMGAKALEVGLVDGISSFQEAFMTAKLLARS